MTATIVLLIIAALIALSAGLLFVLPWAVRRAEQERRRAESFARFKANETDRAWTLQDLSELKDRRWKTR